MTEPEPERIAFIHEEYPEGNEIHVCPLCGRATPRHDQETHYRDGSEQRIECCTDCREEFEQDEEQAIDSDVIDPVLFDLFWSWAKAKQAELRLSGSGLNEARADTLARIYDAEAWQSGGGIWLVIKRGPDGCIIVFSDDAVCLYAGEADFDDGRAQTAIQLDI